MHFIAADVTDSAWMAQLPREQGERFLFLAEGLFMYLAADQVRALVVRLRDTFPGAELVCEVANSRIVSIMHNRFGRGKLRRQFSLSEDVVFQSGLERSAEMESWAPGIRVLDEWTYFDTREPRLGWMAWFSRWDLFRRPQWTIHARLGP
jgi:O-methyltransferase involved in polyketide biosynthesis